MADGAPPKTPDDTKKTPVADGAAQPVVPAAKDASATAEPPKTETPKIIIPAITRHAPLPDVKPEAASERKPVDVQPETKPGETKTAEAKPADKKDDAQKDKSLKVKLLEKGVDAAGFGDIWKAWKSPHNRFRNVMKSIGNKAADMIAGRIVSMTFRLIAITWVAAIIGGVSTVGGMALLALATGASSGIYSYGKDYLHERFAGPKEKRKDAKLINKARALSAGRSFLTGTLNGVLGAWLAKTGILQKALGMVKDFVFTGGGLLSDHFTNAAAKTVTAPLSMNVPHVSSAFSAAAQPSEKVLPLPQLAFAAQANPPAISPYSTFKRY